MLEKMIALVLHWESSHGDERRLDYPREGLSVAEGPRLQAAGATGAGSPAFLQIRLITGPDWGTPEAGWPGEQEEGRGATVFFMAFCIYNGAHVLLSSS